MNLGTHIKLADGREATVVYNSLIGVGIIWGIHYPDPADFVGSSGNTVNWEKPDGWPWEPEALLRNPSEKFPGLFEKYGFFDKDCVGIEYEVISK